MDLRETIDFLKKKNSEAQAVIQGALNGTDITPKGERSLQHTLSWWIFGYAAAKWWIRDRVDRIGSFSC